MVQRILRITEDTVFKLRPEQAMGLADDELYPVRAGSTFNLQSYAYADINGDFDGHIKIALLNTSIRGLNTWFVYSLHVQVEFDGEVVYPQEDQETIHLLRINTDTVFKRRPLDAAALSASEQYAVNRGRSFRLHSYAYADSQGDFSEHIKFALRDRQDYIQGLSTWFVYENHAYVEFDGEVVYPPEASDMPILRITQDTVFKRRPLPAASLPPAETFNVTAGTTWKLDSYAYATRQGDFNDHIKFTLKYEKDYIQNLSTWYVYEGHAQVERAGTVVYPIPTPLPPTPPVPAPSPIYRGRRIRLPGNTSIFYTDQPIIAGGNFTWGEATKNGTRIPESETIVNNIIALARELQKARDRIGRPFKINSWYRPPEINRAVGGATRSQHLSGKAADIQVSGYSGRRAANAVLSWWKGGIGIYRNLPNVIHLDIGSRRTWGF